MLRRAAGFLRCDSVSHTVCSWEKRKLPRLNRVTRRVPENLCEAGMNVRTVDSRAPPYRLGLDLTQDLFSRLAK
jgi:hypothetical protein